MRWISIVVALSLGLGSCVSRSAYMAQSNKLNGLSKAFRQLEDYLQQYEGENGDLRRKLQTFEGSVADASAVKKQREKLEKLIKQLESFGGNKIDPNITVIRGADGSAGLRIPNAVLFSSGSDVISDRGKATIAKVVPVLQQYLSSQGGRIRIDGHSDSDPIRKSKWASNLHLSAARALSVSKALSANGISYGKLTVQGMGPLVPVDAGDKAKNRRVELFFVK